MTSEPLRLSLTDLRASSTKGKWWLVGAAWSGNPLVEDQADINASLTRENVDGSLGKEAHLLRLAKRQGMNTDVRRRVFVALMSGEVTLFHVFIY